MARSAPHRYAVCGLVLETDEPLGELPLRPAGAAETDARIEWHAPLPAGDASAVALFTSSVGGGDRLTVQRAAGGSLWKYGDGTRFWVSDDANVVRCEAPSHYTADDVATYLLGPILGFLLRQRGVSILHGSTVQIGPRAVTCIGPAGAGKSTLAAALVARGDTLVAEDVSAICHMAPPRIAAGLPYVKLWGDSAAHHGDLPRLTPNWDKRYLAAAKVAEDAVELHAICVLRRGAEPGLERLEPRAALVALVDNAYLSYALNPAQRAADLDIFSALVDTIPTFVLTRTDDFDELGAVCQLIEEAIA